LVVALAQGLTISVETTIAEHAVPQTDGRPVCRTLSTCQSARNHADGSLTWTTHRRERAARLPGSHRWEGTDGGGCDAAAHLATAGDVLLIRPLVAHSSGRCSPDTQRHRRILHFEFAAAPELPDGYAWHTYIAGIRADPVATGGQASSAHLMYDRVRSRASALPAAIHDQVEHLETMPSKAVVRLGSTTPETSPAAQDSRELIHGADARRPSP
jgi:hypothetical protein